MSFPLGSPIFAVSFRERAILRRIPNTVFFQMLKFGFIKTIYIIWTCFLFTLFKLEHGTISTFKKQYGCIWGFSKILVPQMSYVGYLKIMFNLVWPPHSNSDHQDYYMFNRESQPRPKPSFTTVTVRGPHLHVNMQFIQPDLENR